jgi:hypothetical protein
VKKNLLNRFLYGTKKIEKHGELQKNIQQRKLNIEKANKLAKRSLIVTWSYKQRWKYDPKIRWYSPFTFEAILPSHYNAHEFCDEWLSQYERNNDGSIKETVIIDNSIIKVFPGAFVDNEDAIVPNINMFGGGVLKYEGMRGVGEISYKNTNNQCVYECWKERYNRCPDTSRFYDGKEMKAWDSLETNSL